MSRSNHFVRFGLPFLTFMVGGTYALSYMGNSRNQLKDEVARQQALLSTEGRVVIPNEITPPQPGEYKIVRIPRPPESSSHDTTPS